MLEVDVNRVEADVDLELRLVDAVLGLLLEVGLSRNTDDIVHVLVKTLGGVALVINPPHQSRLDLLAVIQVPLAKQ